VEDARPAAAVVAGEREGRTLAAITGDVIVFTVLLFTTYWWN
jgi:hypothetical protein